jgi:diphthamide biosynthesis protein 4
MNPLEVLGLTQAQSRSPELVKKAYHAALLKAHPDTNKLKAGSGELTVDEVKRAYLTLSRGLVEDDASSSKEKIGYAVADLDDFEERQCANEVAATDETAEEHLYYWLDCRCGHGYKITEDDLEHGRDLVMCTGCSLLVRVLYEAADAPAT